MTALVHSKTIPSEFKFTLMPPTGGYSLESAPRSKLRKSNLNLNMVITVANEISSPVHHQYHKWTTLERSIHHHLYIIIAIIIGIATIKVTVDRAASHAPFLQHPVNKLCAATVQYTSVSSYWSLWWLYGNYSCARLIISKDMFVSNALIRFDTFHMML